MQKKWMKKLTIMAVGLGLLTMSQAAFAAPYVLDNTHTEVGFHVTHLMISKVKGRFLKFDGGFDFDEKSGLLKDVQVKIQTASISTDNVKRDEHLSGPDFFDVKKFPEMMFKGDKVDAKEGKPVKIHGNLTIHGVTKPVALDLEYRGFMVDPWKNEKVGFSASGKINRKDFGLTWNQNLDKGGVAVSDEVSIVIEGEAAKVKK